MVVLNVTGTVATGQTFTINSGATSTLEISNTATTAAAIAMSNNNQTLEIGGAGNLTITAAENITDGNITMVSGSKLTMFGTVASAAAITGTGTITATGGQTLDLQGTVPGTVALSITNTAGTTLELDGAVASTVTFAGANGTLDLANPSGFTGTISGLNIATNNQSTATNQIDFGNLGIMSASLNGSTLTVVDNSGQSYALTLGTAPAAGTEAVLKSDGNGGTDVFLSSPAATDTFTAEIQTTHGYQATATRGVPTLHKLRLKAPILHF